MGKAEIQWKRTRLEPFWSLEREKKLRNGMQAKYLGKAPRKARDLEKSWASECVAVKEYRPTKTISLADRQQVPISPQCAAAKGHSFLHVLPQHVSGLCQVRMRNILSLPRKDCRPGTRKVAKRRERKSRATWGCPCPCPLVL